MNGLMTLENCLTRLNEKRITHPHLTRIWIQYLSSRLPSPSTKDINACVVALANMEEICDIKTSHIPAIYGICMLLSDCKSIYTYDNKQL